MLNYSNQDIHNENKHKMGGGESFSDFATTQAVMSTVSYLVLSFIISFNYFFKFLNLCVYDTQFDKRILKRREIGTKSIIST